MASRVIAEPGMVYQELGWVIRPIARLTASDGVGYEFETKFTLPKGSTISGAKSQNDYPKFNTPDDVIRVYSLSPTNVLETEEHTFYVVPTGAKWSIPRRSEKITIVKESQGQWIWHVYHAINEGHE